MKHTLLGKIHILLPLGTAAVFLLYYQVSAWPPEAKVSVFLQVITTAFPLIISMICALSVQLEEQGHFQTFLLSASRKWYALAAKWAALLLSGLLSLSFAVAVFAIGFQAIIEKNPYTAADYIQIVIIIWGGEALLYLFHLFLSLKFGRGISIGIGIAEAMLAALLLTGLGKDCWSYFLCGWSGRISDSLLLYKTQRNGSAIPNYSPVTGVESITMMLISIVMICLIFWWFQYFEGRKGQD